jgi:hypothetical protein
LVIPGESIHEWENLVASGPIHEDINVWQWKVILKASLVKVSEINGNTNLSILLLHRWLINGFFHRATGGFLNGLGCAAACDRWNWNYLCWPLLASTTSCKTRAPTPPSAQAGILGSPLPSLSSPSVICQICKTAVHSAPTLTALSRPQAPTSAIWEGRSSADTVQEGKPKQPIYIGSDEDDSLWDYGEETNVVDEDMESAVALKWGDREGFTFWDKKKRYALFQYSLSIRSSSNTVYGRFFCIVVCGSQTSRNRRIYPDRAQILLWLSLPRLTRHVLLLNALVWE